MRARRRIAVNGTVQGVGFRPFVYRLAQELALGGWVRNGIAGVEIEIEGRGEDLEVFGDRLRTELPPIACIDSLETEDIACTGERGFRIELSDDGQRATVSVSADVATCSECVGEIFDPKNRRYRYPFTNCTHCGPRYTITRRLPYDRPFTTMAPFPLCPECQREYDDPLNRRFHAQPNACPECGPCYWIEPTPPRSDAADVIYETAHMLREGKILAIKGVGGFHLACRASDDELVKKLRRRKQRELKPLAVMVPDLQWADRLAHIGAEGRKLLSDPAAPILLAPKRQPEALAPSVAHHSSDYGVMLPYTAFHHLLLAAVGEPLVMTSANLSGDAIIIDNEEARERLSEIADYLVLHDREIYQGCDDSVVRLDTNGETGDRIPIRRSRGLAPRPLALPESIPPTLALGGILKVTIGISRENRAVLSQHLGDLDNATTVNSFHETIDHLLGLWAVVPEIVAYDLHPMSRGFQVKEEFGGTAIGVQHHHAHMASVMVEHGLRGRTLGLSFDGTGYGTDGTIWGGEFLLGDAVEFERVDHVPSFPLPGGDAAIRHPWRCAAGLLWSLLGEEAATAWTHHAAPDTDAARTVLSMLRSGVGCISTSSLGRVYDAITAILGLCSTTQYEGQAPLILERVAGVPRGIEPNGLPAPAADGREYFAALLTHVMDELRHLGNVADAAAWAQSALAHWAAERAIALAHAGAVSDVVASGGCLVNGWLRTRLRERLPAAGLRPYFNREVPAGDGGLALGQIAVAAARAAKG